METPHRRLIGSKVLVLLNLGLFIALSVNIAGRTSGSRNWWGPTGCPQPRNYSYNAISYGDTIFTSKLPTVIDLLYSSGEAPAATQIVMVPFFGRSSITNVAQYSARFRQVVVNGVENVIVLYQPFNVSVPERAWRLAEKWIQQADYRVILDKTGNVVTDIGLEPCECLYAVVWDQHNVVKWAGDARLSDAAYWNLISEVAQGLR